MKYMWHVPAVIVLLIYLPAAIVGELVYADKYSAEMLALLVIFTVSYYLFFPKFRRFLNKPHVHHRLAHYGRVFNWRFLAFSAICLYFITLLIASFTVEHTPIGAALLGGGELDIARARAELFATRQGPEALLRYSALILGKSVMPFIVLYLFYKQSRFRYIALFALLCALLVALEKSAPIFALLPLLVLFFIRKRWWCVLSYGFGLVFCVAFWSFLAGGGLDKGRGAIYSTDVPTFSQPTKSAWPSFSPGGQGIDRERVYLVHDFLVEVDPLLFRMSKSIRIFNRVVWVPYITAYDWLRFHDEVLKGELTLGQQIGLISWLNGKPKLELEQMVYDFQLGPPDAGAGAANTIFLADSKLAFGWLGVVLQCILFAFLSAVIFSSKNEVAKISSVTSFYVAALSPLSATMLSGGLLFFIFMALFQQPVGVVIKNDQGVVKSCAE